MPIRRLTTASTTRRMMRVGASSALATGVDVLCLIALVELVGVYVTFAAFFAATAGGVTNYLVNKFWAFRDTSAIRLRQVVSYALVSLLNAAFIALAVHLFAVVLGMPYLFAKALAAVVVFAAWSYPAQAVFVFPRARS